MTRLAVNQPTTSHRFSCCFSSSVPRPVDLISFHGEQQLVEDVIVDSAELYNTIIVNKEISG